MEVPETAVSVHYYLYSKVVKLECHTRLSGHSQTFYGQSILGLQHICCR